jgi:AcrR family transcriptional regulator
LDAAIELIAEHGVDATSMDAIAGKSGVSKATIYKHWPDKEALLLEVLAQINGLHTRPVFDSGDIRADMAAVLCYRPAESAEKRERIMPHLVAYSARNIEFGKTWRDMVMQPPRNELTHLLNLGMRRRLLRSRLDLDLSLALLLGPIIYSHVFLGRGSGDVRRLAEGVVDAFWRSFAREPASIARPGKASRG